MPLSLVVLTKVMTLILHRFYYVELMIPLTIVSPQKNIDIRISLQQYGPIVEDHRNRLVQLTAKF